MTQRRRNEFLWGAATSSHQIEGDNRWNDWWAWEAQGHIEGGVRSGRAADHWNRFREDIRLAKDLGLSSYRFSIEWSRVEREEGVWNRESIDWYKELLGECEKHRIVPMVTLHHFTLPKWLADRGGFASENAPDVFAKFTHRIVQEIGSRVWLWCTLNEPIVYLIGAHLGRFMPPAELSPDRAAVAFSNLLAAHSLAYDIIRAHNPQAMVGFAHNMMHFTPARRYHPLEVVISRKLERLYNHAWLDATVKGKQSFWLPGILPKPPVVRELLGKRKCDFIGVNYYTRAYVQWRPRTKDPGQIEGVPIGISFSRRREQASDLDWAIDPKGFGEVLRQAASYGLPLYVTENGIADRDDRLRPEFLVNHVTEVAKALEEGIDIRGYYHWSLMDNFEWIKGFWPRFGLYSVDYETMQRVPTRSARIYRDLIQHHNESAPDLAILKRFQPE